MRRICGPLYDGDPGPHCGVSFDDLRQMAVCPHVSLGSYTVGLPLVSEADLIDAEDLIDAYWTGLSETPKDDE